MSARLDALDPPLRGLIEDAALVGRVFWPEAVAAIGDRTEEEVSRGLAELVRRNVVRASRRSSVAGQAEHAFWHLALRDAAAEHMDPARRAAAHRAALDWATSMTGDRVADHAEILANHVVAALDTDRAGNLEPARRYLHLAGDRAAGLDPSRAAELYERAAELHPPDSREHAGLLARAAAMASED
jgi:predicted ATPase